MTRLIHALAAFALSVAPAQADDDYCNDYWFVRNQIFDHAGYCFSSPLGKALFDNANCTTTAPELSPEDRALVAEIKRNEAELGCAVDTSATSLPIPLLSMRLALRDPAARDPNMGSGCYGWTGPKIALHSAHRSGAPVLYTLQPGDDLVFLYATSNAPEGWDYVEVERDGEPVGLGWFNTAFDPAFCTMMAG